MLSIKTICLIGYRFIPILLLLIILAGCALQPPMVPIPYPKKLGPEIRVGIVTGQSAVEFSCSSDFQMTDSVGTFLAGGKKGEKWHAAVKTSSPAVLAYRLVAASLNDRGKTRERARRIENEGYEVIIEPIGRYLQIEGKTFYNNRYYRIYFKPIFQNLEEAKFFRQTLPDTYDTFITKDKIEDPQGTILFTNQDSSSTFESVSSVTIQGTIITIYEIPVGTGYHWEHQEESRSYSGLIQIGLGNDGQLAVTDILPVEKYLSGVIPSEMPSGFPLEALKAQSVSARSKTLANFGLNHRNDPFDLCSDVHCQVYSGLTNQSAPTNRAVEETAGLIIWKDDKICDAIYGSVCGGHGEDSDKAWGSQPKSYLQGHFDGPHNLKRYGSLSEEERSRLWIDDNPPAYCNTTRGWNLDAMNYTKKYFRWENVLQQEEIKTSLQTYMDKDMGTILDLVPLERGVSGRITKMQVACEKDTFIIQGELNIRKALSSNTLWSSCFYVLKQSNVDGFPSGFIIRGSGWGHGVGMCQTGAAVLALKGKQFDQILKYYFKGTRIRRIY